MLGIWFSSVILPFAVHEWPVKTKEYFLYYPIDILVTGYDILFFLVFRMIMFGLFLTSKASFKNVFAYGLIRDDFGKKMSKSIGNTMNPLILINGLNFNDLVKRDFSFLY